MALPCVQKPPNLTEDYELVLSVASPLEVVHNAPLLRRIASFFAAAGETERAALAALVGNALQDAGQALRELTSEALEAVLARRTTTRVSLEIAAPRGASCQRIWMIHRPICSLSTWELSRSTAPLEKDATRGGAADSRRLAARGRRMRPRSTINLRSSSLQCRC